MTDLRAVTPEMWTAVPAGGERSIRQIAGHVGACKWMYDNSAFGDGRMSWNDPVGELGVTMEELQTSRSLGDKEPSGKEFGDKEPGEKEPGDKEPSNKELGDKEPFDKEPGEKEPGDKEAEIIIDESASTVLQHSPLNTGQSRVLTRAEDGVLHARSPHV